MWTAFRVAFLAALRESDGLSRQSLSSAFYKIVKKAAISGGLVLVQFLDAQSPHSTKVVHKPQQRRVFGLADTSS